MYCPFCKTEETRVTNSRLITNGARVKRRRQCLLCHERFTTFETAELEVPLVVKRDGRREEFNVNNLKAGMLRALAKRPISADRLEEVIVDIMLNLRSRGEREIASITIGELVMQQLYKLDHIAYVRFASVYKRFQDMDDFQQTINAMNQKHQGQQ